MKTSNMIVPNLLLGMAGGIQYRALVKATKYSIELYQITEDWDQRLGDAH